MPVTTSTMLKWGVLVTNRQGSPTTCHRGKKMDVGADIGHTYLWRTRRCSRRRFSYHRAGARRSRMGCGERQELTTIYITHGHGDHFFGIGALLDRFPNAKAVATADVLKVMRRQMSPESSRVSGGTLSGQYPEHLVLPEELRGNVIDLEGRELVAVEVGHTDTDNTTCLHVPSVGLVVAGDAAYNDVHLYLAESTAQTRRDWITALDTIETLKPRAVIAGHKKADRNDSPRIIEETRQYIRDFERVASMTSTAKELYDQMLEIYPDRANPGSLWGSAHVAKP